MQRDRAIEYSSGWGTQGLKLFERGDGGGGGGRGDSGVVWWRSVAMAVTAPGRQCGRIAQR